MLIVSVEGPALLTAVDGVVGGVGVGGQVFGRGRVRGDELIDEGLGDPDRGGAAGAVFQAAEGRRRGERLPRLGGDAGAELEPGVGAEVLMVVEVLVTRDDRRDP